MIKNLLTTFCALFLFASVGVSQITSVGLLGSATPGGWETDTDMTLINEMDSIYSLDVTLFDGVVKFRANDEWMINWGGADFPKGLGEQDGPDIPVFAGDYTVTLNVKTGEYCFDVDSDIGIIGSATANGWDSDINMFKDQTNPNRFFVQLDLTAGEEANEVKFRKDDDWAVNWGGEGFPEGVATQDGPNIIVDEAGPYFVSLDTMTGEYLFESNKTYATIGLIGDATPGGWDVDTNMVNDPNDANLWTLIITLTDGEVKFRADDDWIDNWGGTDFPSGVGVPGGDNIQVTAGDYFVSFNSNTLEYEFREIVEYGSVGIIGNATPGDWAEDTDMEKDANDVHQWSIRLELLDGEAKFRADDAWDVNWGSGDFPAGVATQDGANIPVTAGDYIISFNSLSGAYEFREVVEYGTVGLIGMSGPNADWDNDVPMDKNADDFNLWTLTSVTVTDYDPADDATGVKFRADNDWAVNWGDVAFPSGVGTNGGPNIQTVAGTYGVTFNSSTGEYIFSDPLSNDDIIIDPSSISVFPNPAQNSISIDVSNLDIAGTVNIVISDMKGAQALSQKVDVSQLQNLDVSSLGTGQYLITIYGDNLIVGKRLTIAK